MSKWNFRNHIFVLLMIQCFHSFYHHFACGQEILCQANSSTHLVSPCSNCSFLRNNTQHIKGYEIIDIFPSVHGCSVNGVLVRNNDLNITEYKENHIIYVKNKSVQKVYLTVKNVPLSLKSLSYIRPKFALVLLSTKPIDWIVSSDDGINFEYFVSSESTLKRHESDQIIPAHHPSISTTTDSGRPYHAAQIEDKVCTKLLKPKFCNITSFLQFQAVDFLQLTVGKVNNSLPATKKCEVLPLQRVQDENRVKATLLTSKTPVQSCSEDIPVVTEYLFLIEVSNHTRNADIRLELNGLSTLMKGGSVHIVLDSSVPVRWIPYDAKGQDLSVTITFVVSDGSTVDASDLSFFNDSGAIHVQTYPHMIPAGETLLDTSRKIFNISQTSYAKFINQPTMLKLFFLSYDVMNSWGPPQEIPELLLLFLHSEMQVTAWGSRLRISNTIMRNFDFAVSDVTIGDGSCFHREDGNYVIFEDLARCGLVRTDIDIFKVNIKINKREGVIRYLIPGKDPKLKITDLRTNTEILHPQRIHDQMNSYTIEISGKEHSRYGMFSQVEHCYLYDVNSTQKLLLIDQNRPAKTYVSLLLPYESTPPSLHMNFLLLLDAHTSLQPQHLYNLTCTLSICFAFTNKSALSNLLPECYDQYQTFGYSKSRSEKQQQSNFTQEVSLNLFIYEPTVTHEGTPPSNGNSSGLMVPTDRTRQSNSDLDIVMYILVAVVGFVLGALLLFIICSCSYRRHYPPRRGRELSLVKIDMNGVSDKTDIGLLHSQHSSKNGLIASKKLQHMELKANRELDSHETSEMRHLINSPSPSSCCTPNSDSAGIGQTSLSQSSPATTDCEGGENDKISSPNEGIISQTATEYQKCTY